MVIRYGDTVVLREFDLTVRQGELIALLGSSGCGKTSLLRAVAGFVPLASGHELVQRRRIPGDDAPRLEPPDPRLHRGHRQSGLRGECREGRPTVGGQQSDQEPVGVVVEALHAAQGNHSTRSRPGSAHWTL